MLQSAGINSAIQTEELGYAEKIRVGQCHTVHCIAEQISAEHCHAVNCYMSHQSFVAEEEESSHQTGGQEWKLRPAGANTPVQYTTLQVPLQKYSTVQVLLH